MTNDKPRPPVLARYLASCGLGSRRDCEQLISDQRISIDGQLIASPATRVEAGADVRLDGRRVEPQAACHLMLNKPRDYVCTARDRHARKRALDLVAAPAGQRLFSVGRLDKDSEGLLLFTNDGDLAERLAHPRHGVLKTYHVDVTGPVQPREFDALLTGINDDGERLTAQSVEILQANRKRARLAIVVGEGRKREIRRMIIHLGHRVLALRRVSFGPLELGDLQPGKCRPLTAAEVALLEAAGR